MKVVPYTSERFPQLRETVHQMNRGLAMSHRPFVDWYYKDNPWSRLYLAIDNDKILGTLGVESIPFQVGERIEKVGFGSNFHVLNDGIGGLLFIRWIRANPNAMVIGGSDDTQRILKGQHWSNPTDLKILTYNAPASSASNQPKALQALKHAIRKWQRKPPLQQRINRLSAVFPPEVAIESITDFTLGNVNFRSAWQVRLAADPAYLNWRYPRDGAVSYQRFAILSQGASQGYVILIDGPENIVVSLIDATSPEMAHTGTLLALAQVQGDRKKPILLSFSDPILIERFCRSGFRLSSFNSPVWFQHPLEFPETSLAINYGLGDNDLRLENFSPE
ncbi:MAG: hypothetical protein KDN20_15525 [Verrucomicrobiae bacterium]|nr:hypothetical protein [Verrucomicrobiae bacterium]